MAMVDVPDTVFTVAEVAEQLKVNEDTVRRLFLREPGVIVICFPRKGRRVYRTVRIPKTVLQRVITRLTAMAPWLGTVRELVNGDLPRDRSPSAWAARLWGTFGRALLAFVHNAVGVPVAAGVLYPFF